MVLRRPPFGKKAKTAHDMSREYRMLKALRPVFPYCPEVLAFTEDESVMGCQFYVMERIKGIILRKDIPEELHITPDKATKLCENLIRIQSDLHNVDYGAVDLTVTESPKGMCSARLTDGAGDTAPHGPRTRRILKR